MNSIHSFILATLAVLTMAGCASAPQQYWHHASKSTQQHYQDISSCTALANTGGNQYQNVPESTRQIVDTSGLQNAIGQAEESNRRSQLRNQCMYGKGWVLRTADSSRAVASKPSNWTKPAPVKFKGSKISSTTKPPMNSEYFAHPSS